MEKTALEILENLEKDLFAGKDIKPYFAENAFYEVSGKAPFGGRFEGPAEIERCFEERLVGVGPGLEYQEVSRHKYQSADGKKAIAEIHEKSWHKDDPGDVLEVRTCSIATVYNGKIISLIDYTDSQAYEIFANKHKHQLPKFNK